VRSAEAALLSAREHHVPRAHGQEAGLRASLLVLINWIRELVCPREGGRREHSGDNDCFGTLKDFQQALQGMSATELEQFVADLLARSGRFLDVRLVHGAKEYGKDIEAFEPDPLLTRPRRWIFQVKKMRLAGADLATYLKFIAKVAERDDPSSQVVLATSGSLTGPALEALKGTNVQVWDSQKLSQLATPELIEYYFGTRREGVTPDSDASKANEFRVMLTATPTGKEAWSAYQRLVADIFEFLFCPPLEPPRYELPDADIRNKRDMIFENPHGVGFWAQVRADYSAHYIVVDAKNYDKPINKRSVLDIAHYLKPYGCGLFALLVSRQRPSPAAAHATREQWIGGNKMIVHLDDSHIQEMLELRASGGETQEVVRRQIANFRMSL
jgi:hypothetical protein